MSAGRDFFDSLFFVARQPMFSSALRRRPLSKQGNVNFKAIFPAANLHSLFIQGKVLRKTLHGFFLAMVAARPFPLYNGGVPRGKHKATKEKDLPVRETPVP